MEYLATALTKKDVKRMREAARKIPIKTCTSPTYFDRLPAELRQQILDNALLIASGCRASLQEHGQTVHNLLEALPALRQDLLHVLRQRVTRRLEERYTDTSFISAVVKTVWLERVLLERADSRFWHISENTTFWEVVNRRIYCSVDPETSLPDLSCSYCGLHDDEHTVLRSETNSVLREQTRSRLIRGECREYARRAALREELQIQWRDYFEIMPQWLISSLVLIGWALLVKEKQMDPMPICFFENVARWRKLCVLPFALQAAIYLGFPGLFMWGCMHTIIPEQMYLGGARKVEIYAREKLKMPRLQHSKAIRLIEHMSCFLIIVSWVELFCAVVAAILYRSKLDIGKAPLERLPLIMLVGFVIFFAVDLVLFRKDGDDITVMSLNFRVRGVRVSFKLL